MGNNQDILGTFALSQQIEGLQQKINDILDDRDPFAQMIPEEEFSRKTGISASVLRRHRSNGTLKESWRKLGKHIFWSPRKFWDELGEIQ